MRHNPTSVNHIADNWERSHEMTKLEHGKWELILPHVNGTPQIPHMSHVKVE